MAETHPPTEAELWGIGVIAGQVSELLPGVTMFPNELLPVFEKPNGKRINLVNIMIVRREA